MDAWYQISHKIIHDNHGTYLLENHYADSVSQCVVTVYNTHPWVLWKFNHVPHGFWEYKLHHRQYYDWLGEQLGYKKMVHWYEITYSLVHKHCGGGLLPYYKDSPSHAVMSVYHDHPWNIWRFVGTHTFGSSLGSQFWQDQANHKKYFDWLAVQLAITNLQDWYSVHIQQVIDRHGEAVLFHCYEGSLSRALVVTYPEHIWMEDKFTEVPAAFWNKYRRFSQWLKEQRVDTEYEWGLGVPPNFWSVKARQRSYFDWLAEQLGFKQMDDWYTITARQIYDHYGRSFLNETYAGSPSKALISVYSDHPWTMWRFSCVPAGFWDEPHNQRDCLDWLAGQLDYKSLDDWYSISWQQLQDNGGGALLKQHNDSAFRLVMSVYNYHPWTMWKFAGVRFFGGSLGREFWEKIANQRIYFEWLASELGVKHWSDWYAVQVQQIADHFGEAMMFHCHDSNLYKAMVSVYPEHAWVEGQFAPDGLRNKYESFRKWLESRGGAQNGSWGINVTAGFWTEPAIHVEYFHWLGELLRFSRKEQWYSINKEQITHRFYGSGLLNEYDGSLSRALSAVYPQHHWEWWKSVDQGTQREFWQARNNHQHVVEHIAKVLSIRAPQDWYRISSSMIKKIKGGEALLVHHGRSLVKALSNVYPDMVWEFRPKSGRAGPPKQSAQLYLKSMLCRLHFDDLELEHKSSSIVSPTSKKSLPVDIYSPSKRIAFEYQGEHHFTRYRWFPFPSHSVSAQSRRDMERRQACNEGGITLIPIPFWWNREESSLVATIRQYRPELLRDHVHARSDPIRDPYDGLVEQSNLNRNRNRNPGQFLLGQQWSLEMIWIDQRLTPTSVDAQQNCAVI